MLSRYAFILFFLSLVCSNNLRGLYKTPQELFKAIQKENKGRYIRAKEIRQAINQIPLDKNGYFNAEVNIQQWLLENSKKYRFKTLYQCPICYQKTAKFLTLKNCNHTFCWTCLITQYVIKNYSGYTHTKCALCRSWFGEKIRKALKKHPSYKKLYDFHEGGRIRNRKREIAEQIAEDRRLAETLQTEPNQEEVSDLQHYYDHYDQYYSAYDSSDD